MVTTQTAFEQRINMRSFRHLASMLPLCFTILLCSWVGALPCRAWRWGSCFIAWGWHWRCSTCELI